MPPAPPVAWPPAPHRLGCGRGRPRQTTGRTGSARFSASASNRAVSLRAVWLMPRSRSLTARWLTCAAAASSSCVSPASLRSRRNSPPKPSPPCSATGLLVPPPARPRPAHPGCGARTASPPILILCLFLCLFTYGDRPDPWRQWKYNDKPATRKKHPDAPAHLWISRWSGIPDPFQAARRTIIMTTKAPSNVVQAGTGNARGSDGAPPDAALPRRPCPPRPFGTDTDRR